MQLCSSSAKSQFSPRLFISQNPNPPKFFSKISVKSLSPPPLIKLPASSSSSSKQSTPSVKETLLSLQSESDSEDDEEEKEKGDNDKIRGGVGSDGILVIRRPMIDSPASSSLESKEESPSSVQESEDGQGASQMASARSAIDQGLSEFAKKMPIFEPKRTNGGTEKPLTVNLDLALYRAKGLARNFQHAEAEKLLLQCISIWPEDGRAYVALGKILSKQSKYSEARSVYERGSQATQGENSYIWQCWAVLENKIGNIQRARELFDAATVADEKHAAAWHGWAVLELQEGNIKKARNLLGKGLKYCGGNEYIYQTLALLEAKGNRIEQARYLFQQATICNPKSCASWLAWAQLEMQQENNHIARRLFERAVQVSPKNRFAWHAWALFEANLGNTEKGRKLLKIGHALNPRDPVILQSLALMEYKHSSANLARVLFSRASEIDPTHQPIWTAWGWVEWKEGNMATARELYQKALSIDSTTESAAHCLQAWGVLEERLGNLSAARRLFRSSLNINSQSYVTWMTWASLEEQNGNPERAEEIRNLYFQQRTEVVDDASWVMGFLDIIDPALESIKKLLMMGQKSNSAGHDTPRNMANTGKTSDEESADLSRGIKVGSMKGSKEEDIGNAAGNFDLDAFITEKLSLDPSKLDDIIEAFKPRKIRSIRTFRTGNKKAALSS